MSKSGKEIVAEAARRAAEQCGRALGLSGTQAEHGIALIVAQDHFAPVAELIEAARRQREQCLCTCDECEDLHASLAKVEKQGGGLGARHDIS